MENLGSGFNGIRLSGIEYDEDLLLEAGIEQTDLLLAVTPDENLNITVSLVAKKIYQVEKIIARVVNPNRTFIYDQLGIETINPIQVSVNLLKSKLVE